MNECRKYETKAGGKRAKLNKNNPITCVNVLWSVNVCVGQRLTQILGNKLKETKLILKDTDTYTSIISMSNLGSNENEMSNKK